MLPKKKPKLISNKKNNIKKYKRVVFVYIAARNDLYIFSITNKRQMTEVGLNENLAIVIDYHELGKRGVQRYLIDKNNPILIYQDARNVDSGDANTLIDFVRWGVSTFDAENYGLVIWDHATSGFLDPNLSRSIEQAELCGYPLLTNELATITPVGLPSFIMQELEKKEVKGSCFDDAYRSYINNQNLEISLETIHKEILHGKLWEFIGFDTCLQADIATACIVQPYARYLVASEQTEPGSGWNYYRTFLPVSEKYMDTESLVKQIVAGYEQTYSPFLNDYTLSAIDLSKFSLLEQNINDIASLLMQCIQYQRGRSVKDAIRLSGNARLCTCFDEPNLKDWWHFLENLLKNLDLFKFNDEALGQQLKAQLTATLIYGIKIQSEIVVANCVGKSFTKAKGLTIYLPETRIHSSVAKTKFVRKGNKWYDFLKIYLMP